MAIAMVIRESIAKLTNFMANGLKRFRTWLSEKRNFFFSRYTKDIKETQEPERSLVQLPPELRKKLVDAVETIPSNSADKEAIASTLDKSFNIWRENPSNADNSVVILSSPVVTVSRILSETLEEWTKQRQVNLKLLPLKNRPIDIEAIRSKLEHYFQQPESNEEEDKELEVVVIPNLSWCFLRSVEGLAGIEYIQSLLCDGSKNRFWIIGGGQGGWQYLSSVCALEAYCGEILTLPAIPSEKLQSWLDPVIDELGIVFDEPRIEQQILDRDKDNKTNYFDRLADISQGVATVALQGFLKSIRYEEADEDESKDRAIAQTPKLPKLPDLESADRYLLYSLLLHGDLTISSLAQSLGDSESEVQGRVQLLRREGVVEQSDGILKINPIYYPKIKQELAANNFIINRE